MSISISTFQNVYDSFGFRGLTSSMAGFWPASEIIESASKISAHSSKRNRDMREVQKYDSQLRKLTQLNLNSLISDKQAFIKGIKDNYSQLCQFSGLSNLKNNSVLAKFFKYDDAAELNTYPLKVDQQKVENRVGVIYQNNSRNISRNLADFRQAVALMNTIAEAQFNVEYAKSDLKTSVCLLALAGLVWLSFYYVSENNIRLDIDLVLFMLFFAVKLILNMLNDCL